MQTETASPESNSTLPVNERHNGNVARLPKALRDKVSRHPDSGIQCPASRIRHPASRIAPFLHQKPPSAGIKFMSRKNLSKLPSPNGTAVQRHPTPNSNL